MRPTHSRQEASPQARGTEALAALVTSQLRFSAADSETAAQLQPPQRDISPGNAYADQIEAGGTKRIHRIHRNDANVKLRTADGKTIWTIEEDQRVLSFVVRWIREHGLGPTAPYTEWGWDQCSVMYLGKSRTSKQCRERWANVLDPLSKHEEPWSVGEIELLLELHRQMGNKWREIAKRCPGRTTNKVKNLFYSCDRRIRKAIPQLDPHGAAYASALRKELLRVQATHTGGGGSGQAAAASSGSARPVRQARKVYEPAGSPPQPRGPSHSAPDDVTPPVFTRAMHLPSMAHGMGSYPSTLPYTMPTALPIPWPAAPGQWPMPPASMQWPGMSAASGQWPMPPASMQWPGMPAASGQWPMAPASGQLSMPQASGQLPMPTASGQFSMAPASAQFPMPTASAQFPTPTANEQLRPHQHWQVGQPYQPLPSPHPTTTAPAMGAARGILTVTPTGMMLIAPDGTVTTHQAFPARGAHASTTATSRSMAPKQQWFQDDEERRRHAPLLSFPLPPRQTTDSASSSVPSNFASSLFTGRANVDAPPAVAMRATKATIPPLSYRPSSGQTPLSRPTPPLEPQTMEQQQETRNEMMHHHTGSSSDGGNGGPSMSQHRFAGGLASLVRAAVGDGADEAANAPESFTPPLPVYGDVQRRSIPPGRAQGSAIAASHSSSYSSLPDPLLAPMAEPFAPAQGSTPTPRHLLSSERGDAGAPMQPSQGADIVVQSKYHQHHAGLEMRSTLLLDRTVSLPSAHALGTTSTHCASMSLDQDAQPPHSAAPAPHPHSPLAAAATTAAGSLPAAVSASKRDRGTRAAERRHPPTEPGYARHASPPNGALGAIGGSGGGSARERRPSKTPSAATTTSSSSGFHAKRGKDGESSPSLPRAAAGTAVVTGEALRMLQRDQAAEQRSKTEAGVPTSWPAAVDGTTDDRHGLWTDPTRPSVVTDTAAGRALT